VADAFRWNAWNLEHATRHGVTPEEAEHVVRFARSPYPRHHRKDTWLVVGRADGGRVIEVVYLIDPDGTVYIIHAMPLSARRRSHRRRRRRS
jgi:hypothetical protein